jgi:ABC-2 type transport system ATP-binding protein
MENVIEIQQLTKSYPHFKLNNISLVVPKGMIMGLIGENGAGKTTLIKAILNIIKPDNGVITIFNKDNIQYEKQVKEEIGVVLDDAFFADTLKVKDIVKIVKNLYQNWDQTTFRSYLKQFNLPDDQVVKTFSKGMKKKLEIAVALSHHPKLLILDEPTSGLDPIARNEILDILRDFIQDEEHAILLSSHITSDLEHIADYITFINDGRLLFTTTQDDLLNNYGLIKCSEREFTQIAKNDYVTFKRNLYNYELLTTDKTSLSVKYPNLIIDRPTIEDIMLLYIKGERPCLD